MDNVFNHRMNLERALHCTLDVIVGLGYAVPVKRRDPREPKRLLKMKIERVIQDIFYRRFKRQLETLEQYGYEKAKPKPKFQLPDWEEEEYFDELIAIFFQALKGGIEVFSDQVQIGMDFTKPNMNALKWAQEYSYKLVKGIDTTTRDVVSNAISGFIEKPGFTMGDIIDLLRPTFGDRRASMIAVTETTRAFAQGQKIAGMALQAEFPDVKVLKTWFTNNDDRVCEICAPLDGKSIPMDEEFEAGDPPAHVNCRCWTEYNTSING